MVGFHPVGFLLGLPGVSVLNLVLYPDQQADRRVEHQQPDRSTVGPPIIPLHTKYTKYNPV